MQSQQKLYIDQKYEQGLDTIRTRLNHLSKSRTLMPGYQDSTPTHFAQGSVDFAPKLQNRKSSGTNFLHKVKSLQQQTEQLQSQIKLQNAFVRQLKLKKQQIEENIIKSIDAQVEKLKSSVLILGQEVKKGIEKSDRRREKISEQYHSNHAANAKIKLCLTQILNRVSEIEHCLGVSVTLRQKL